MDYQDEPRSFRDSAQDTEGLRPGDQNNGRHRGPQRRASGNQDQRQDTFPGRRYPDQDRSGDRYQDQGGTQARYADRGRNGNGGRYQDQGRPDGSFWDRPASSQDRYQDVGQTRYQDAGQDRYQDANVTQPVFSNSGHQERYQAGNSGYQERYQAGWDAPQDPAWAQAPQDPAWPQGPPGRPPARHDDFDGPPPGGRGLLAGAVTGVLAAAIALGVAMLVSAFIRPQASPIIAVGGQAINLTPTPLKEFAVAHFGTNDKTMLLGGMYVTIALLAMVIGWLARRRLIIGVIGLGAFGVLGAVVALIQPASRTTDAIPALIGGVAGVVAIVALVRGSTPVAFSSAPGRGLALRSPGGAGVVDRRKFLAAGAATAAVAAGAGVGGQILTGRRFNANASRAAVRLAAPAKKPPPVPKQAELNIPGLSSFYTPNSSFYRVDTALVIPQVTTQQWSLRVHGMVGKELNISFNDLLHMPMVERDITIMCVSDAVGGNYIGNARWQGVLLSDVLRQARMQSGVTQLATTDVNGMTVGVASDIALDGRDTLLAVGMNGVALPQDHGFPVRLIVPGLYGFCSATKWITDMELTTLGAFTPYWVHRGWTQVSPTKTESRIDTPSPFHGSVKAGTVTVAGVAWAQHKGVEQVEVRFDGGAWTKATLATQDTIDTWRQWYLPWQATAGQHTLEVRATDQTGYVQTPTNVGTFPNGATGYHTVHITVA